MESSFERLSFSLKFPLGFGSSSFAGGALSCIPSYLIVGFGDQSQEQADLAVKKALQIGIFLWNLVF